MNFTKIILFVIGVLASVHWFESQCFGIQESDSLLAYISKRDGNFEIYSCDSEGKNHRRLTKNPGMDWNPAWNEKLNGILYYSNDAQLGFCVKLMDLDGSAMEFESPRNDGFAPSLKADRFAFSKKINGATQIFVSEWGKNKPQQMTRDGSYNGRMKWSPQGDRLAFISDRGGNNDVFVMSVSSKQTKQITNSPEREKYITWSPDGNQIAYTKQPDGGTEDIFIYDFKTGVESRVTENNFADVEIAWSPCGKWIAYHSPRNGEDHIYSIRTDGSDERKLTSAKAYHGEPAWIPIRAKEQESRQSRELVVFSSKRDSAYAQLYLKDLSDGSVKRLTNENYHHRRPRISPDGSLIAYESYERSKPDICTIRIDGSGKTRLTTNDESDLGPSWSPDGSKIVFSSSRSGVTNLWVLDLISKQQNQITNTKGSEWRPDWSPTGQQIVFQMPVDGDEEVFVLDVSTGTATRLTEAKGRDGWPIWSPDGKEIVFFSERSGKSCIYLMQSNGLNQKKVVDLPGTSFFATFSPAGDKLLFSRETDNHNDWDLWTCRKDGSSAKLLESSSSRDFQADWKSIER